MLRKLLILAVCAGALASIPHFIQSYTDVAVPGGAGETAAPGPVIVAEAPRPQVATTTLAGRKVRIAADPRGHFSAEFKLNGRRVDAMVDTGATLVAINLSTARRIGLAIAPGDFTYTVDTANGQARAAAATIARLEIGRIMIADVQALVMEDQALKGTLIGASFLNRLGKYQVEDGALLLVQ